MSLTFTVLPPRSNNVSDTIYISIYLYMNVVHMHSNLRDCRPVAKKHQMHMSDIKS